MVKTDGYKIYHYKHSCKNIPKNFPAEKNQLKQTFVENSFCPNTWGQNEPVRKKTAKASKVWMIPEIYA